MSPAAAFQNWAREARQARKDPKVLRDHKDHKVLRARKDPKVRRDRKDPKARKDRKEHRALFYLLPTFML